tara:strand:+ start:868 stop:2082 length:1215 start_codon:yes stop_codon:yes gene_type:complete
MNTWFKTSDINIKNLIKNKLYTENIRGYVLPHAGTTYTGNILSHTLRFSPKNYFNNVLILYYPANEKENVILNESEKYHHEYYVLWKTLDYVIRKKWKYGKKTFSKINVRELSSENDLSIQKYLHNLNKTLLIISADFSHFLELHESIKKENCAAHAIMHRHFPRNLECLNVVDIIDTFKLMYQYIPNNWILQWLGRTRSPGTKGVGYLSFLIKQPQKKLKLPNGIFVTAYDNEMQQRECLGEWFTEAKKYSKIIENDLIKKVINLARTTSRLTGGNYLDVPVKYYTITYLYKDLKSIRNRKTRKTRITRKHRIKRRLQFITPKFIRGYHGIKQDAFYLPDVMLENVFNNGKWILPHDQTWPKNNTYNMKETLLKIQNKAGRFNRKIDKDHELYYTDVVHGIVR